jgi:hypothetical protein
MAARGGTVSVGHFVIWRRTSESCGAEDLVCSVRARWISGKSTDNNKMARFPHSVSMVVLSTGLVLQFALTPAWGRTFAELEPAQVARVVDVLPESPKGLTPPCRNRDAWSEPQIVNRLRPVVRKAGALILEKFPEWSDEKYLEFARTGESKNGQEMMHARRSWIMPLVLAECTEYSGRFLPYIEKVIAELIKQRTWILPTHDPDLAIFQGRKHYVELYSAELAEQLAEAIYLLREELNPGVRSQVLYALEERVFAPVRDSLISGKGNSWLHRTNNWNAVCLKGVTGAALTVLADRDDRALFAAAAEHYSKNYLAGFPDDGYAVEGLAYWNYGFGRFIELRERLWRATDGRVNLFADAKVQKIALFGERFPMFPNNAAAFGDSVLATKPDPAILSYIHDTLDSCIASPQKVTSTKLFMLFPRDEASPRRRCDDTQSSRARQYFENAGVLVSRPIDKSQSHLAVTIKADGNGPHSHNDIGSYAIALGDQQPVGDPGGLRYYSKRTFGANRYESKVLNSYGHPVPVVAGQLQVDATKVIPKVLSTSFSEKRDEIVIDMAPAYAVPDLKSLKRRMQYDRRGAGSVVIEDAFEFSEPQDFEVALTTQGKWKRLNNNTLVFDTGGRRLQATIDAPGTFDILGERISENGTEFDRIGIRLKEPRKSGAVRILFQEKH